VLIHADDAIFESRCDFLTNALPDEHIVARQLYSAPPLAIIRTC
jgi:hypothetical protein